ncbi:MAG: aspartate aminotransferase family protein, partial [Chloroflexi bacterium]|nr:aspartate aminotransferase family protein [Chloroflexota bacterium]
MDNVPELEQRYFLSTIRRLPVTMVRGEGARLWDDRGKEYLDFVAGWAVVSLGHCHPALVQAITDQVSKLLQVSNQYYTIPQVQLAELLIENSCLNKLFFSNSGAEACEGAVKLARRYGKLHLEGAYEVITANNSFHGRTLAMVAATGQKRFHDPYTPLPAGFVNVPYNDIEALKQATTSQTCAVMLEPLQGEGGVNLPSEGYFQQVRAWCDQKGILLILDEVQTGIGRTGTLFAYQWLGIEPDIMTLAKGLGGGVPIGAFLAKERAAVFSPGEHGSTFGGNPLVTAAAYAVCKFIIDYDVPAQVQRVGKYLMAGLEALKSSFPFITQVRGRGLLVAVEFDRDIADSLVRSCLEKGLLLNPVKPNALRFMPPLIITEAEVDQALAILRQALASPLP